GALREVGRGPSIWDLYIHRPVNIRAGRNSDVAYVASHRYDDDIALLRQIGYTAYRISNALPSIIPGRAGPVNEAGLAYHYRLDHALLEAGIEPFVTLYRWDLPQALDNRLGWTSRATPVAFAEYASVVARRLGDRVTYWATHNEPWCSAFLGYHTGHLAPGYHDFKAALSASHNLLLSHGLAVPAIRAAVSRPLQVGIVLNLTPAYPASDTEEDQAAARRFDGYFNRWFLDPLAGRGY